MGSKQRPSTKPVLSHQTNCSLLIFVLVYGLAGWKQLTLYTFKHNYTLVSITCSYIVHIVSYIENSHVTSFEPYQLINWHGYNRQKLKPCSTCEFPDSFSCQGRTCTL